MNKSSLIYYEDQLATVSSEYAKASTTLNNTPSVATLKATIVGSSIGVALGLVMMGISIYNIVKIVNSYKVDYTDIPLNMVDCKETENGDRFIRYSVVESFYKDGNKVKTRAGDTNAYNGKQWVSIYYTKSYEAGKCLLTTYDLPTSEADFGKYTPIHEFGKNSTCYNLNNYGKNSAEKVFIAFSNSNDKKAADTAVPSVVGSILNYGTAGLGCAIGIGIGMGIMEMLNRKNKRKQEVAE